MGEVLGWHRHKLHGLWCCTVHKELPDTCVSCILANCMICGGAEASLPTDCPGYRMEPSVDNAVLEGVLDFTARLGWHLLRRRASDRSGQ